MPAKDNDQDSWPGNGFVTIDKELVYYDAVERDMYGRVNKLTRCIRGLEGEVREHLAGTPVYANVVAQHHNQLVDAILRLEAVVGTITGDLDEVNTVPVPTKFGFDAEVADVDLAFSQSLGFAVGKLLAYGTNWNDACPDVDFVFNTISTTDGIMGEYCVKIYGNFTNYVLNFGDGESTTNFAGTHLYTGTIDPMVSVTSANCTVVMKPLTPTPGCVSPSITPTPYSFHIPIPSSILFPSFTAPKLTCPGPLFSFPPIGGTCMDMSQICSCFPSVFSHIVRISGCNLPSQISIVGCCPPSRISYVGCCPPSFISYIGCCPPSRISFVGCCPPSVISIVGCCPPSVISIVGCKLPSTISIIGPPPISFAQVPSFPCISFCPFPQISCISFCNVPSIAPISFSAFPRVPCISFCAPPSFSPISFSPAPTISIAAFPNAPVISFGRFPTVPCVSFCALPTFPKISFAAFPTAPCISFCAPPSFSPISFTAAPKIEPISFAAFPQVACISFCAAPTIAPISFAAFPKVPCISFCAPPSFACISFCTPPSFAPIKFDKPPTISVDWRTPPTLSCIVTVACPVSSTSTGTGGSAPPMGFAPDFQDGFGMGMAEDIPVTLNDIGIPEEIKLIVPHIPDVKLTHDLPTELRLVHDLPTELRLVHDLHKEIKLNADDVPKSIPIDASGLPRSILVEPAPNFPTVIRLELDMPQSLQVTGFPKSIELVGPSFIQLVMPENPVVRMVYDGAPLQLTLNPEVEKLLKNLAVVAPGN